MGCAKSYAGLVGGLRLAIPLPEVRPHCYAAAGPCESHLAVDLMQALRNRWVRVEARLSGASEASTASLGGPREVGRSRLGWVPLTGYLIFGVCAVLGAVMIGFWCYERVVRSRHGRGRRW
jgi:hypothetical protein